jgi:hypothetical protein
VADIDFDGDMDIVMGCNVNACPYYTCKGKIYFWINPGESGEWSLEEADTTYEKLEFSAEHVNAWEVDEWWWYDCDNDELEKQPESYRQRANPAIGDIDMDGVLELIVGTAPGNLFCYKMVDNDYHKWENVTNETIFKRNEITVAFDWDTVFNCYAGGNTRPSLFDIDFDGDLDLLVSDSGNNYHINQDDLHLYLNQASKRFIEVTCLEGCDQNAWPGKTVSFKFKIKNNSQHAANVEGRFVAYYSDNHPYHADSGIPIYSDEGTIPAGQHVIKRPSYQFPDSLRLNGLWEQIF